MVMVINSHTCLYFAGQELKEARSKNQNLLRFIREKYNLSTNAQNAILCSYDWQSGSYIDQLNDQDFRVKHEKFTNEIAKVVKKLKPSSLLDAGVGEATSLVNIVKNADLDESCKILAFDLSWSRIHCGSNYWCKHSNREVMWFVGELESIALPESSVEVVLTVHAIEPNHGREEEILDELYRVASRYVVLVEPDYERANNESRSRMDFHVYCRELRTIVQKKGWNIIDDRQIETSTNPSNPSGLLIIEKQNKGIISTTAPKWVCPLCFQLLHFHAGHSFCANDGIVYPVLNGIPCLVRANGIVASLFDKVDEKNEKD